MNAGSDLERKYRIALGLYAVLAVLVWFTIGEGAVLVQGKPVEIRLIPLAVVGIFVLRTWMAREAEKIRRRREDEAG